MIEAEEIDGPGTTDPARDQALAVAREPDGGADELVAESATGAERREVVEEPLEHLRVGAAFYRALAEESIPEAQERPARSRGFEGIQRRAHGHVGRAF